MIHRQKFLESKEDCGAAFAKLDFPFASQYASTEVWHTVLELGNTAFVTFVHNLTQIWWCEFAVRD